MRSNSGKDESRNNMRDPTMRDRDLGRGETATRRKPRRRRTTGKGARTRRHRIR